MRIKPKDIIHTLKKNNMNISHTAKILQINRSTVWRWRKRAQKRSLSSIGFISSRSLERLSTRPKVIYRVISETEEKAIIKLRKQEGYTAQKIKHELKLQVSWMSVHRFLKRNNLLNRYGNHIRPRYQKTTHMNLKNTKEVGFLQMDVKYITPELSGLPYTCFEYAVIDIYSRYKEAVILNHLDQDGSISALLQILPKLPFKPMFIQTDNGLEFQGRFDKYCLDRGLKHHLIHKSTPNENAVIERTFRTDEEEFFFRMKRAPKHYDELRKWFAEYIYDYNYQRPHLGINLKTPYEVVANVMLN